MRLVKLALLLPLVAGCATASPGPRQEPGPAVSPQPIVAVGAERETHDSLAERLTREVPDLLGRAEIPGLSVAVVRAGGVTWTGAFGVREAGTDARVTDRTVFQAASLSKPVFAYLVMRLVERGVIDLDRPLARYAPNPRMEVDARYRTITGRMVLSHSTGLPNWGGDTLRLAFDPGTGFRYSGEGYVYLQQVVESVTGLGLDELARREVFEPLGMSRSSYLWQDRFADDAALGHDALGRPRPLRRRSEANAAASLLTTAGDYGRFLAAVLTGQGLAPGTLDRMLAPAVEARRPGPARPGEGRIQWALGWGLETGPEAAFWHWGDNGAFKAYVAAFPARDGAVVYFANSVHGLSIAEDLVRLATGIRPVGARWAGYDQHDDPAVVARRELYHAFTSGGIDRGLARLEELRAEDPSPVDADLAQDLAELLSAGERDREAIALLEHARAAFVDAGGVRDALGEAYLRAGRLEDALATYRALATGADGEEAGRFAARADWVELRLRARGDAVRIPPDRLRALVGRYGPREITLEDGVLYYQRDDNPRYRLVPLTPVLFQPEGLETFRIRFALDHTGAPASIVGLYFDGSRDETPRDPGPRGERR